PGIEERIESFPSFRVELNGWKHRRTIGAARAITEDELCTAILKDKMDQLPGKLEIDRHGDEACSHDAETRGDVFGAVGGEDRDPVTAGKTASLQRTRDGVRHCVELRICELAHTSFAEIDDRRLVEVVVAADKIAEIGKERHRLLNS